MTDFINFAKAGKTMLPTASAKSQDVFSKIIFGIAIIVIVYILYNAYKGIDLVKGIAADVVEMPKKTYQALTGVPQTTDLRIAEPTYNVSPVIQAAMANYYREYEPTRLVDLGVTSIVGSCPEGYYREYFGETCKPTIATQLRIQPDAPYIVPEAKIEIAGTQIVGSCPTGYYRELFGDICIQGDSWDRVKSWFTW